VSAPGLDDPPGYPEAWVSDIVTADGRTVHVRPIRPADAEAIRRLHARCSAETIYYRFFTPLPVLSDQLLEHFVVVDYEDRMAFVAEWENEIIAVARYDRLADAADAEVAFLVDDAHQGKGLGAGKNKKK
jgi:GNAT superfamily N-acetyltransferase